MKLSPFVWAVGGGGTAGALFLGGGAAIPTTAAWVPHTLQRRHTPTSRSTISTRLLHPIPAPLGPPPSTSCTAVPSSRASAHCRRTSLLVVAVEHIDAEAEDDDDGTGNTKSGHPNQPQPHLWLTLYNSLTRQKEVFTKSPTAHNSLDERDDNNHHETDDRSTTIIRMYTCGPTVYDSAHVGNFRAFLTYDLVKRVLNYLGYWRIWHILNITDVDDKILRRAQMEHVPVGAIGQLTQRYENMFLDDLHALNCLPATHYPRATDHVPSMIRFVQDLHHRGLAYETKDGSWYFDTQQQPPGGDHGEMRSYGQQLVQLDFDNMVEQKQTENSDGKKHFADFCLWKAYKENDIDRPDAAWDSTSFFNTSMSPSQRGDGGVNNFEAETAMQRLQRLQPQPLAAPVVRRGRPGWHLECSAMARTYFGDTTMDFHGGGVDLQFPHHENEIAQSQGWMNHPPLLRNQEGTKEEDSDRRLQYNSNKRYCNCWFHNGFVNFGDDNVKMSKSLGNFVTLAQACPTPADVRAYRYLVLSSHYRNPLRFTDTVLAAAKSAVQRLDQVRAGLDAVLPPPPPRPDDDHSAARDQDNDDDTRDDRSNNSDTTSTAASKSELATTIVPTALASFDAAITDDLSMPRAAAALFTLVKAAERELKKRGAAAPRDDDDDNDAPTNADNAVDLVGLRAISDAMERMDQVFGIFYQVPGSSHDDDMVSRDEHGGAVVVVPDQVMELVGQRIAAKEAKDWALADDLRNRIAKLGFVVKDVKSGEPIVTPVEQLSSTLS